MAGNDQVDPRIDAFQYVDQRPGHAGAAFVVIADLGVESLVDRDDNRVHILRFEFGDRTIDRLGLVAEGQAGDPARRYQRRRFLERQPDHPDRNFALAFAEGADAVGGKQRRAVGHDHIGGEEREIGACILLDRARFAHGVLLAAAFVDALELAPTAVEFVIAHRVEIEPEPVHRADRRLVEEDRGHQRTAADQIARRDHQRMFVLGARLGHRTGEIGGPGGEHAALGPVL